jgi:phage shock protein A
MWASFVRMIRSFLGFFIRSAENPRLLLRQAMEDLRNEIPKMNRQAAEIVAHQKMLEGQVERTADKIAELEKKAEVAVKGGPEMKQAALVLLEQLEAEEAKMEDLRAGLQRAKENSENILKMRAAFEQRTKKQIEECRAQLSRAEMADAEEKMASLMGSFEVGDITDTLDSVTEKIDERMARARAKMEVAGESTDAKIAEVELMAGTAAAEDKYAEMSRRFGLSTEDEEKSETKTMSAVEDFAEYDPLPENSDRVGIATNSGD